MRVFRGDNRSRNCDDYYSEDWHRVTNWNCHRQHDLTRGGYETQAYDNRKKKHTLPVTMSPSIPGSARCSS